MWPSPYLLGIIPRAYLCSEGRRGVTSPLWWSLWFTLVAMPLGPSKGFPQGGSGLLPGPLPLP